MTMTRFGIYAFSTALALGACKPRSKGGSSLDSSFEQKYYKGHADYRLTLIGHTGSDFNPNDDLFSPSEAQKFRESVATSLQQAALTSLVPIMNQVNGNYSDPDFLLNCLALAQNARTSLSKSLKSIQSAPGGKYPYVADAWLVPWEQTVEENFYDAGKISMSSLEYANVLRSTPGSEAFFKQVSNDIQTRRKKLRAKSETPVFLLGIRQFLFVNPGKSLLTIRLLLGVKPYSGAFEKDDPKVKFKRVVVPDFEDKGITAAITIEVPLETNEDPTLKASFGDFASIEGGNFKMLEASRQKTAPRLEGTSNTTGTKWVELNFAFKELEVNLRKAQLTDLSSLISPGFKVGDGRWTVGGISADSVDKTFQDEINKTIDASINDALKNANDKILDGRLSKDTLGKMFNLIFQRA